MKTHFIYLLFEYYINSISDVAENKAPTISPIAQKEYTCRQSKYGDHVPRLPTRCTILAPSFSGKTVLISNLILDVYRGCFNRIYIFSPTIKIDDKFKPVKDYIATEIKPHEKEQKNSTITIQKIYKQLLINNIKL